MAKKDWLRPFGNVLVGGVGTERELGNKRFPARSLPPNTARAALRAPDNPGSGV